jgi:hypothetical protein
MHCPAVAVYSDEREALPQQFHAVHLCLGTTSAVVSAPISPDCAAEVFRGAQGLVARDGTRRCWFPGFGISAGWNDGMSASIGDDIVTIARVVSAVHCPAGDCMQSPRGGGDAADLLIRRDLAQKVRVHRRIHCPAVACLQATRGADVAAGNLDRPYLQRLFVNPKVDLAPDPSF